MLKKLMLATGAAAAIAAPAEAVTLNGVSGNWSNPSGGVDVMYDEVKGEEQIRWGIPKVKLQSGLGFKGSASQEITAGETFELGTLRHFNRTIRYGSVRSADLSLALDFAEFGTQQFDFTLGVTETSNLRDNVEDCPFFSTRTCSDQIYWDTLIPDQTFVSNGVEYGLELLGFRVGAELTPAASFISQEAETSEAVIVARLTERTLDTASVPEPGSTLGLLALGGVAGLATAAKRRNEAA